MLTHIFPAPFKLTNGLLHCFFVTRLRHSPRTRHRRNMSASPITRLSSASGLGSTSSSSPQAASSRTTMPSCRHSSRMCATQYSHQACRTTRDPRTSSTHTVALVFSASRLPVHSTPLLAWRSMKTLLKPRVPTPRSTGCRRHDARSQRALHPPSLLTSAGSLLHVLQWSSTRRAKAATNSSSANCWTSVRRRWCT